MKKKVSLLTIVLITSISSLIGQSMPDSAELKMFWDTQIAQIISKDSVQLNNSIQFPVSGLWAMFLGFGEPTDKWGEEKFFSNIDILIPPELISNLESQSYKNIEIINELGFTELLITYERNTMPMENGEVDEGAMLFCYKQINGIWKLWSIQIVG